MCIFLVQFHIHILSHLMDECTQSNTVRRAIKRSQIDYTGNNKHKHLLVDCCPCRFWPACMNMSAGVSLKHQQAPLSCLLWFEVMS